MANRVARKRSAPKPTAKRRSTPSAGAGRPSSLLDTRIVYCGDCLDQLGKLPDDVRVFCGHEYTESNLKFAAHLDPDNAAVTRKLAAVQQLRSGAAADWHDATPAEMTIPSTLGEEREINPFMRAKDAQDLGRVRALKDGF